MRMIALSLVSAAAIAFAATNASAQTIRVVETGPRVVYAAPVPAPAVVVTAPIAPRVVYDVGCGPYYHNSYWYWHRYHHHHHHHR